MATTVPGSPGPMSLAVAHGDGAVQLTADQVADDGQPEALGGVDVEAVGSPDPSSMTSRVRLLRSLTRWTWMWPTG